MSTGYIGNTAGKGAVRYAQKRAARGRPVRQHDTAGRRPGWASYLFLLVVFVVSVFPLYAAAMYGSSTSQEIARAVGDLPTWFPTLVLLENFREVVTASQFNFWTAFANSVLVAVAVTASTVFFSTLAGFSFAKLTFRGRQVLYVTVIATMAIPAQVGTIPMFIMMNDFGWIDSLAALTVPTLVTAFGVFWMTQYLQEALPFELVEAARVDGASMFRTFWSIAMPAARPGGRHAGAVHVRRVLEQLLLAVGGDALAADHAARGAAAQGRVHQRHRPGDVRGVPGRGAAAGGVRGRREAAGVRRHVGGGQGLTPGAGAGRGAGRVAGCRGRPARHTPSSSSARASERRFAAS
ncbi:carbohydrate ABC transporter permease [Cellulomonas sp. Y8]|uniref:carbohydrate ABC transporter permease n=1 Tax=Cellulomonas sp. Y8 TaxID=2591145 RepID=UPI00352806C6